MSSSGIPDDGTSSNTTHLPKEKDLYALPDVGLTSPLAFDFDWATSPSNLVFDYEKDNARDVKSENKERKEGGVEKKDEVVRVGMDTTAAPLVEPLSHEHVHRKDSGKRQGVLERNLSIETKSSHASGSEHPSKEFGPKTADLLELFPAVPSIGTFVPMVPMLPMQSTDAQPSLPKVATPVETTKTHHPSASLPTASPMNTLPEGVATPPPRSFTPPVSQRGIGGSSIVPPRPFTPPPSTPPPPRSSVLDLDGVRHSPALSARRMEVVRAETPPPPTPPPKSPHMTARHAVAHYESAAVARNSPKAASRTVAQSVDKVGSPQVQSSVLSQFGFKNVVSSSPISKKREMNNAKKDASIASQLAHVSNPALQGSVDAKTPPVSSRSVRSIPERVQTPPFVAPAPNTSPRLLPAMKISAKAQQILAGASELPPAVFSADTSPPVSHSKRPSLASIASQKDELPSLPPEPPTMRPTRRGSDDDAIKSMLTRMSQNSARSARTTSNASKASSTRGSSEGVVVDLPPARRESKESTRSNDGKPGMVIKTPSVGRRSFEESSMSPNTPPKDVNTMASSPVEPVPRTSHSSDRAYVPHEQAIPEEGEELEHIDVVKQGSLPPGKRSSAPTSPVVSVYAAVPVEHAPTLMTLAVTPASPVSPIAAPRLPPVPSPTFAQWNNHPIPRNSHVEPQAFIAKSPQPPRLPYFDGSRNLSTGALDRRPMSNVSTLSRHTRVPSAYENFQAVQQSTQGSFTLMHARGALDAYRQAAKKAKDPSIQYEFAKFLLEQARQQWIDERGTNPDASMEEDENEPLVLPRMPGAMGDAGSIHSRNSMDLESLFGDNTNLSDGRERTLAQEALYWYTRLAKAGHAEAAHQLGCWYEAGSRLLDLKKNNEKAARYFETGAKLGHGGCSYKMGVWCESRKEFNRALQFYNKACASNHPGANTRLGKALLFGELKQKQNVRMGVRYLLRASDNPTKEYNEGPYLLGLLQADLHPTLKLPKDLLLNDVREARRNLDKAASLGNGDARYRLGWAYEFGELGIQETDPRISFELYRLAATENRHADAMMGLSGWYLTGIEGALPPNEQLAFEWCQAAAQMGLPKAEYAMGYYYEVGIYVQQDSKQSWQWYELAASHGSPDARRRMEKRNTYRARKRDYGSIKVRKKEKECSIM